MPTPRFGLAFTVSLALAAIGGCGTRANPDFCCTTDESCLSAGVTRVGCDDPGKPVCDDNGQYGTPRTCIADPMSSECNAPTDCTNPDRPLCIGNRCVECADGAACDNPRPACNQETHLCDGCTSAADCVGDPGGPQCAEALGLCVECGGSEDCTTAAAPVCDATEHACRGCVADDECGAGGVCDRSAGACAPAAEILYVAIGGGGVACTQAAPCATVAAALLAAGTNDRTIKIGPGTFNDNVVITGAHTIRLHGSGARMTGGTTLAAAASNLHVVTVSAGATAILDDLFITGASGNAAPNGVRCTDGNLTLRRTWIDGNPGGGVGITRCSFDLVNNLITRNGGPTSGFGGVSLNELLAGTTARFELNTVANNQGPDAGTIAGVNCNTINIPINLDYSIIYNNGTATREYGTDKDCVARHSIIGETAPLGDNVNVDPRFLSSTDAHLSSTSPLRDTVTDPAVMLDHDVDNQPRPAGAGREPGADELP